MPFDAATYVFDPLTLTTPRERLEYLRDRLRQLAPHRFDMRHVHTRDGAYAMERPSPDDCGTAACILGWAQHIFQTDDDWCDGLLGLSRDQANALYCPWGYFEGADETGRPYTLARAVAVLDRLLKTGEVDWNAAA